MGRVTVCVTVWRPLPQLLLTRNQLIDHPVTFTFFVALPTAEHKFQNQIKITCCSDLIANLLTRMTSSLCRMYVAVTDFGKTADSRCGQRNGGHCCHPNHERDFHIDKPLTLTHSSQASGRQPFMPVASSTPPLATIPPSPSPCTKKQRHTHIPSATSRSNTQTRQCQKPRRLHAKGTKDLVQAASLIDYLATNDAELLRETWAGLLSQGPGWRSRAMEGLKAIKERYPDVDTAALRL